MQVLDDVKAIQDSNRGGKPKAHSMRILGTSNFIS